MCVAQIQKNIDTTPRRGMNVHSSDTARIMNIERCHDSNMSDQHKFCSDMMVEYSYS